MEKSLAMNFNGCANCLMHGWKQVEDQSELELCNNCKFIKYCSKECKDEHWARVHKNHCEFFSDPKKAEEWAHEEDDCTICLLSAHVSKADLRRPTNRNYECIFKEEFPPRMYHPHPFPLAGQPGDTYEKCIIVLWQLLKKFELTQPRVTENCRGEIVNLFAELKMTRLGIWKNRKVSSHPEYLNLNFCPLNLFEVRVDLIIEDPFELWNTIVLVNRILLGLIFCGELQLLIDPVADMPTDFQDAVSQGVSNSASFLTMANQVLEALTNRVLPYQDVLRIICGGNLENPCSFCSEKVSISAVIFPYLMTEIYCCGKKNCLEQENSMQMDDFKLDLAVHTAVLRREETVCVFCSKLPPRMDVHRCSRCLTVIYCSANCQNQDWGVHKGFCKEDVDERKKKCDPSGRRKARRHALEQMEKAVEKLDIKECSIEAEKVVGKFRDKNTSK